MLSNIVADITTIKSLQLILKGGLITLIEDFVQVFERWKELLEEDGGNTKSIVLNDLQVYIKSLKEVFKMEITIKKRINASFIAHQIYPVSNQEDKDKYIIKDKDQLIQQLKSLKEDALLNAHSKFQDNIFYQDYNALDIAIMILEEVLRNGTN